VGLAFRPKRVPQNSFCPNAALPYVEAIMHVAGKSLLIALTMLWLSGCSFVPRPCNMTNAGCPSKPDRPDCRWDWLRQPRTTSCESNAGAER
jgi:hypothetical protein